jgi:hypothetical protein
MKPCVQRDRLRKKFELAIKRYQAQIEQTNLAASSVDPVQFKLAQEKQMAIQKAYNSASGAFFQHCEQHQCETTATLALSKAVNAA